MKNKLLLSLLALTIVLVVIFTSLVSCIFVGQQTTTKESSIQSPDGSKAPIDYFETFGLVHTFFQYYSFFDQEIDFEKATLAAIRAYIEMTGDRYAMYYTDEELAELTAENNGDLYGIGVNVVFDYKDYYMYIYRVISNSPAEGKIMPGDKVTHIMVGDKKTAIADIVAENKEKVKELYPTYTEEEINNVACYDAFNYVVSKLKGPEETYARFTVERNGEVIEMSVKRAKVKTESVYYKVSEKDPSVAIVSISGFDMTTPTQFKDCMDKLIASGIKKFVFDLRNNPGGNLASVVAVLSTMLQRNDIILFTKDNSGRVEITKVREQNITNCEVTAKDIGKYAEYEKVVLINENSASAAELFTAALRDHKLATLVGVTTYGKGSVQTTYNLAAAEGYDAHGALKLTTQMYYPPCGEGYDGIGITPDYVVELSEEAQELGIYRLTEANDNQLQKAVELLGK